MKKAVLAILLLLILSGIVLFSRFTEVVSNIDPTFIENFNDYNSRTSSPKHLAQLNEYNSLLSGSINLDTVNKVLEISSRPDDSEINSLMPFFKHADFNKKIDDFILENLKGRTLSEKTQIALKRIAFYSKNCSLSSISGIDLQLLLTSVTKMKQFVGNDSIQFNEYLKALVEYVKKNNFAILYRILKNEILRLQLLVYPPAIEDFLEGAVDAKKLSKYDKYFVHTTINEPQNGLELAKENQSCLFSEKCFFCPPKGLQKESCIPDKLSFFSKKIFCA